MVSIWSYINLITDSEKGCFFFFKWLTEAEGILLKLKDKDKVITTAVTG